MHKTRHLHQRMEQRGITQEMADLVLKFGIPAEGDKIIIDKKNCAQLSQIFSHMKKVTDKMAEKGGLTLVASAESLITVYRLNSFNLAKAMK